MGEREYEWFKTTLFRSLCERGFYKRIYEYLKNPNGECPYDDIDATGTKDENFYNDLAKFLSKCLGDSRYIFEEPDKSQYPFAIKFRDTAVLSDQYIYLTSDQFGFSAPCIDPRRKGGCQYLKLLRVMLRN